LDACVAIGFVAELRAIVARRRFDRPRRNANGDLPANYFIAT